MKCFDKDNSSVISQQSLVISQLSQQLSVVGKEKFMSNDDLRLKSAAYNKAYALAIRIVNAYKYLKDSKKEFVLSKQLLRSGTIIGANVAEAGKAKLS